MKQIIINSSEENQRLDKFLLKYFNKSTKSFIYKMLRKKNIKYNDNKAQGNEILKDGDCIQIYLSDETVNKFKQLPAIIKVKKEFDIVYEDKNILICNKPVGLLSQKDTKENYNCIVDQIIYYLYEKGEYDYNQPFKPAICNRLDRNTSGIIIAGKNLMTLQSINKAIANNQISKFYKTIVCGNITQAGTLEDYYIKDTNKNKAIISSVKENNTSKVITKYKPIKNSKDYTLLEIELVTGKSHQIRSHLKSINHPIIGDVKYGQPQINKIFKSQYRLNYQLLHAYKITFSKLSGDLDYLSFKSFEAPIPKIFSDIERDLFK